MPCPLPQPRHFVSPPPLLVLVLVLSCSPPCLLSRSRVGREVLLLLEVLLPLLPLLLLLLLLPLLPLPWQVPLP